MGRLKKIAGWTPRLLLLGAALYLWYRAYIPFLWALIFD